MKSPLQSYCIKLAQFNANINEIFNQFFISTSKTLLMHAYYGINYQKFSMNAGYFSVSYTYTCKDDKLAASIEAKVNGFKNTNEYFSILIPALDHFPKFNAYFIYLNEFLSNKQVKPINSFSRKCSFELDLIELPLATNTFKLTKNYKITNSFEYCPAVELEYIEIYNSCGIIKTKNGCIALALDFRTLKCINLNYSKTPTKLEFEILLDIAYKRISDNNFEDIIFKHEIDSGNQVPYTNGLNNLGNTCFMNSALQLIINNPHFQKYFQTVSRIDKFQFDRTNYPLLNTANLLFQKLRYNNSPHKEIKELKLAIGGYESKFKGFNQQDSSEFLQCFLTNLNEEFMNYFRSCPKYNNCLDTENLNQLYTHNQLNNGYFNNLFLGFTSTRVSCDTCKNSKSDKFPMINLQLNIPQKKSLQFNLKFTPFNTEMTQISHNLKISLDPNTNIRELKDELSQLISAPAEKLIVAIEKDLGENLKELKPVITEDQTVENLYNLCNNIYCFELPKNYNDKNWGYIYLNQGIKKKSGFEHLGYNLAASQYGVKRNFQYFCEILVQNNRGSNNFLFNSSPKPKKDEKEQISKKPEQSYWESILGIPKTFLPKQEEYIYNNENRFDIIKVNNNSSITNCEKKATPIKSEDQFNEALPLSNGDNIIIRWRENFYSSAISKFKNLCNIVTYKRVPRYYQRATNFVSTPLIPPRTLYLNFINLAEDMISGEKFNIVKPEFQLSLKDCINNDLKPTYFKPHKNPILNWECEYCSSNFGQKRDYLTKLPQYLLINFNRFKMDKTFTNSKNNQFINCPLEFKFNEDRKLVNYLLIGVCNHSGNLSGGHYTSTCKSSFDGKWRNFNDNFVNQIDEISIINSNAYMLMYQRYDSTINKKKLNLDEIPHKSKLLYRL